MLILSFESSCDETGAAVVEGTAVAAGHKVRMLSNIVASQIETHRLYGGVVPEIASRAHAEVISALAYDALREAKTDARDIDAIAVTAKPGLIGALLVGVNFAKGLAYSLGKPLVAVNHVRGHIAANYFEYPQLKPPFLAMAISGGHTSLMMVRDYGDYETIGRTRDDAAGEAFDKVARLLGIGYPGGKELDALAKQGDPHSIPFPSAAVAGDNLDFSFSGPKTAVMNYINRQKQLGIDPAEDETLRRSIAASFTATAVASLTAKLDAALDKYCAEDQPCKPEFLLVAGGVAANSHLRLALGELAARRKIRLCIPSPALCGDNAAMIGAQAYFEIVSCGISAVTAPLTLNAAATGEVEDSRRFGAEHYHQRG